MAIDRQALALVQNHGFHPADTQEKRDHHSEVRSIFLLTALLLHQVLPQGRHRSLAMTELEKAEMWANRALALEHGPAVIDELDDDSITLAYEVVFSKNAMRSREDMVAELKAALAEN